MFSLLFLFLFCHWRSTKFPSQVCHLERLCAGCIGAQGGKEALPGKWGLLCSASQRKQASQWVCHAGISRGLLKWHHFCCYVFDQNTQKSQGTGALINVYVRQNTGFDTSTKVGTQKQIFMLQTSFSFLIHCNKQDCTCQTVLIFSDSTCLISIKVVLCFDKQAVLHEHC